MFDHIGIFVSDSPRSISFYEHCLAPLGIKIAERQPEWGAAIFAGASEYPFLWVGPARGDYYGRALSPSEQRPIHLAFVAPSRKAVDEFHALALAHGGADNGAPEDCGGGYYAAFILDLDGNNLEAGIREPC